MPREVATGELGELYLKGAAVATGYYRMPEQTAEAFDAEGWMQLDAVLGEVGRYYIVPQAGTCPTEAELIAYCEAHLANYKVPRQMVFRSELPLTPVGKIMKSALKEEAAQEPR